MSKFIGRFYVSSAVIYLTASTADKALDKPYLWAFVACHIVCLFFIIKDGVE